MCLVVVVYVPDRLKERIANGVLKLKHFAFLQIQWSVLTE